MDDKKQIWGLLPIRPILPDVAAHDIKDELIRYRVFCSNCNLAKHHAKLEPAPLMTREERHEHFGAIATEIRHLSLYFDQTKTFDASIRAMHTVCEIQATARGHEKCNELLGLDYSQCARCACTMGIIDIFRQTEMGLAEASRFFIPPQYRSADEAFDFLSTMARRAAGETATHLENLKPIVMEACRALQIEGDSKNSLIITAELHDLGKLAIAREILDKPGALSQDEWVEIKLHPIVGEMLVSLFPKTRIAAPAVRHHHERWDGKGYPDGLVGEDIPYEARVFQIIDAADALLSHRPYKPPLDWEKSVKPILLKEAQEGKWDPELLPKMLEILDAKYIPQPT